MRKPFVNLKFNPRCPLPLRPALSLYHAHRFAEAISYLEDLKKGRRISDGIFYVMMTFATGGAALPFFPWAMKDTYDPLFRLLTNCYFQLGNDEAAVRCFGKIFDKTAIDWAIASLSLEALGQTDRATVARQRAVRADPMLGDWLGKDGSESTEA
jgi:tetratricopeptide (TPR) repeat protein